MDTSAAGSAGRPLPVKLLSGQLRAGGAGGGGGGAGAAINLECRVRVGAGRSISVSMVWMQGTVVEAQLDRDLVVLLDETGTFIVRGATSPEPVIRAVKIADLSGDAAIHRRMWKLEVEDLHHHLL
ncbi:hypothetical protein CRUP_018991 [Coryphaenoides rupestris]|nr:hypothetical protein CRUP_018991 [Coryphaenoides rupestris]